MARDPETRCSFCNRTRKETRGMVPGPGVFICSECIDLCSQLIAEEKEGYSPPKDDMPMPAKRIDPALDSSQMDRAIEELKAILQADPEDLRSRLKLGDLHAKREQPLEAGTQYEHVADRYAAMGMPLKAVAVYKHMLRISTPTPSQVHAKLGKLYERLGLWREARASYEEQAHVAERAGEPASAVEGWREKAVRLLLAETEGPVRTSSGLSCSFCKKDQCRVAKLIAGPTVYVCDECVAVAAATLAKSEPP